MLFLADIFPPLQPGIGLIFWTTLIFGVLWFVIGRYGFKPIAQALRDREQHIEDALHEADKARQEMANLKAENEELLIQAREERAAMLKEAKQIQENIISEAKAKADEEYRRKVESAMTEIKNREMEMLINVKNEAGLMALDIAEKLMQRELKGNPEQEAYVKELVGNIKLN
ncbi:MAG: F0F1 ATP synthase subunit B [Bacteroidota bacterium]